MVSRYISFVCSARTVCRLYRAHGVAMSADMCDEQMQLIRLHRTHGVAVSADVF